MLFVTMRECLFRGGRIMHYVKIILPRHFICKRSPGTVLAVIYWLVLVITQHNSAIHI